MSTIKSSNPVDIIVNGTTVLTANGSGISISGSISGSSIFVTNVTSTNPIDSASYALSASEADHAIYAGYADGATVANAANYISTFFAPSVTSSMVITDDGYSGGLSLGATYYHSINLLLVTSSQALTASYFSGSVSNADSASYALTASYAMNGGVTQIIAGNNISISPTSGTGSVTISSTGGGGGVSKGFVIAMAASL